jgi:non-ribosomal peptide synthetase component E (peptide arylation enzyme)
MVCAVVTLTDPTGPITLAEIAESMIAAGTMRQKIPERLEIIETMPRNPSGKVPKHELRATIT